MYINPAQGSKGRGRAGAGGFPKIPTRPNPPPTAVRVGDSQHGCGLERCCYGPWCRVQLFRNAPIIIVKIISIAVSMRAKVINPSEHTKCHARKVTLV